MKNMQGLTAAGRPRMDRESIIWCADRIEVGVDRMVVQLRREVPEFSDLELDYG